jgi:hypothetical protein
MSDELEPFDRDVAALIESGKKDVAPGNDAKARLDRRLRLSISRSVAGPTPRSATRSAFFVMAVAASMALGAGLHAVLRPEKATVAKKGPSSTPTHPASPVPPSIQPLGAFGSTDGSGRALLDAASSSMMRGDATGAVTTLEEHARTHPSGPLTELREAMMVEALARAKRSADAQARADHFFATYPTSLLGPAVSDALQDARDAGGR